MEWLEPWTPIDDRDVNVHESAVRQLRREVAPGHDLFGVPVRMIARNRSDDTLFELVDGSRRVAVVHLTWSSGPAQPPWPIAQVYPSLEIWAERGMRQDHEEHPSG